MPIPKEILAVERPKSTRVKKSGDRYLVIKRTSKRINGKNVPVELGTIGEIINGKYVEIRKEPRKKSKTIDIKDYGLAKLFDDTCNNLLVDLSASFDLKVAKQLYLIALIRAIDNDIKNRDISFSYETSFLSEMIPGIPLSENTISSLLEKVGMEYRYIVDFLNKRVEKFSDSTQVIDGTLVDNNSTVNSFSEFSRKARTKGSKDLTLVYSFDIATKEPVAMKTYVGNMLDSTSITDFLKSFKVKNKLMVLDKGFYTKENIKNFKENLNLSYIIPLKSSSKLIKENNAFKDINNHLKGYDDSTILYNKIKVDDTTFLYAFKNIKTEYEQKLSYIKNQENKGLYDKDKFAGKDDSFGVIVFETNIDLEPLEVYLAYTKRWEIETMFQMMKGIIDLDTVNVHNDYRVIATEFINFLSVIMAQKIKQRFKDTKIKSKSGSEKSLSEIYSYKQLIRYISKIKKVKVYDSNEWVRCETVKYVKEIAEVLSI